MFRLNQRYWIEEEEKDKNNGKARIQRENV